MTITIERVGGDRPGYCLQAELWIEKPRESVFEFFADAHQLQNLTPPWLQFSLLSPGPIEMREGTCIDYQLRVHGIPIRWRSKITGWDPPRQFVDEQVRGPYRYWHHLHAFEDRAGRTLMRDVVHYAVPFSVLLHPLLVRRDLKNIFEYRLRALRRLLPCAPESDNS